MTNEEIRSKVAEAHANAVIAKHKLQPFQQPEGTSGYKCDLSGLWLLKSPEGDTLGMNYPTPKEAVSGFASGMARRWNYPESLDACAEFEKSLTDAEQPRYAINLWEQLTGAPHVFKDSFKFVTATARQRCIAYLKVKGILP